MKNYASENTYTFEQLNFVQSCFCVARSTFHNFQSYKLFVSETETKFKYIDFIQALYNFLSFFPYPTHQFCLESHGQNEKRPMVF
jgi:hypothetical protein